MTRTHPLEHVEAILAVGIGGFAGSNLRYLVELSVPSSLVATMTVNVLGCFALGVLSYEHRFRGTISATSRTLLATGFIASFTTYSTFILDVLTTSPPVAVGYVLGSYTVGFGAVVAGRDTARWITAVTPPISEVND
ncbi:fluoride efflux transporter FluC [Halostagnicola kamekurae]|uniref:Fluoride-specific ion channel FluC n=1 Tax=Halostagnicola kamekurae TaxID=619731 RepID=A0A1I6TIP3_9EURY|nr:CrcB family protein [Halostagnicola kamekurae]SFS89054.1 CrcB protein [Halostagnicola kamekurae]